LWDGVPFRRTSTTLPSASATRAKRKVEDGQRLHRSTRSDMLTKTTYASP
jgi:hypothetical protein